VPGKPALVLDMVQALEHIAVLRRPAEELHTLERGLGRQAVALDRRVEESRIVVPGGQVEEPHMSVAVHGKQAVVPGKLAAALHRQVADRRAEGLGMQVPLAAHKWVEELGRQVVVPGMPWVARK